LVIWVQSSRLSFSWWAAGMIGLLISLQVIELLSLEIWLGQGVAGGAGEWFVAVVLWWLNERLPWWRWWWNWVVVMEGWLMIKKERKWMQVWIEGMGSSWKGRRQIEHDWR
jgi:hypothetical protein